MDFTLVKTNLEKMGYQVREFATGAEAAAALTAEFRGRTIGFGGSVTLQQLGLYESLSRNNTVYWHMHCPEGETVSALRHKACGADIYFSSVNGLAETGEIVNIDNTGNRVSSISYGHEKVVLVVGENKLEPTLEKALYRARNVAAPQNCKRLGVRTPCTVLGHCADCKSPQRLCRNFSILAQKSTGCDYEVVLIHEKLGY